MMPFDVRVEPAALMRRKSSSKVVVEVGGGGAERVQWSRNRGGGGREGRDHGHIREKKKGKEKMCCVK